MTKTLNGIRIMVVFVLMADNRGGLLNKHSARIEGGRRNIDSG